MGGGSGDGPFDLIDSQSQYSWDLGLEGHGFGDIQGYFCQKIAILKSIVSKLLLRSKGWGGSLNALVTRVPSEHNI